ncbi:MAG: hypothetical protein HWE10_08885 [Gammaproteobacteria bacterium]|nr:hypothetical protein [Gammaproteobacteria bacterium]
MFINTVIVLLRDMLPIFILFSYLSVLLTNKSSVKAVGFVLGVALGTLLYLLAESISDMFGGRGSELVKTGLAILGYGCFVRFSVARGFSSKSLYFDLAVVVGVLCVVSSQFSSFLVYLFSQVNGSGNVVTLSTASVIGLGIAMSFSYLYRFLLQALVRHGNTWLVVMCWSLFLSGLLSQVYFHLAQVDMVTIGLKRLELGSWASESSVVGYLFKATIGFELSPVIGQFILYFLAACLLVGLRGFSPVPKVSEGVH